MKHYDPPPLPKLPRAEVARLEAENAALRQRVARLEAEKRRRK